MANMIQIASKMYDARDSCKRLWPDKFPTCIANLQESIRRAMEMTGETELAVMTNFLKQQVDNPVLGMWIMAATVEMIEPSKEAGNE